MPPGIDSGSTGDKRGLCVASERRRAHMPSDVSPGSPGAQHLAGGTSNGSRRDGTTREQRLRVRQSIGRHGSRQQARLIHFLPHRDSFPNWRELPNALLNDAHDLGDDLDLGAINAALERLPVLPARRQVCQDGPEESLPVDPELKRNRQGGCPVANNRGEHRLEDQVLRPLAQRRRCTPCNRFRVDAKR